MSQIPNIIQKENFKFIVLPGSDPDERYLDYYNSAYQCWHSVWDEVYQELGVNKVLYSDEFTRQTEISCLFYGSQCIALLFLRWANFETDIARSDSYFKLWTDEDLKKLTQHGKNILVVSNTTVAKNWRGKDISISIKDLILYLTVQYFLKSDSPAMTAVTRNTRGVDKMIERFGATIFRKNVPNYNAQDLVNIAAIFRKDATEGTDLEVIRIGRKLMRNALIIPRVKTTVASSEHNSKRKSA